MTHAEYVATPREQQAAAHRAYFGQFVTEAVKSFVEFSIGRDRILASTEPYLNDIPLHRWDRLEPGIKSLCLSRMGDIEGRRKVDAHTNHIAWSLSDAVCIAKEVARQIQEDAHVQS